MIASASSNLPEPPAKSPLVPWLGMMLIGLASFLGIVRLTGCGYSAGPTATQGAQSGKSPVTEKGSSHESVAGERSAERAQSLLRAMTTAYQKSPAYSDRGKIRLTFTRNGRPTEQSWDAALQFVRPGRLRMDVFSLHVASDATSAEKQLVAYIADPESNNVDRQVVVRPAPEKLSLETFAADSILLSQLLGKFQRTPVQLELLVAPEPLASLFTEKVKLSLLGSGQVGERLCERVEATAAEGRFVFWIEPQTNLLLRLEYPAKALLPDLAADPLVTEAALVAEMESASWSATESDADYSIDIPRDARRVRAFVLPPIAPYAEMLGKPLAPYSLAKLGGGSVTHETTKGQGTALLWYAHHPVCEEPMKEFARLASQLPEHVACYAVCTEPNDVGDKAVREQLATWGVKVPVARDLKEYRSRVFQVRELPAITLIDAHGRLQWVEAGPTALASFSTAANRLVRGDNLARETLEQQKKLQAQYERIVASGGPAIDLGLAPASKPARLKLEEAWKITNIASPGSVALTASDVGEPRLAIVSSPGTVVELSLAGEVLATHQPQLPAGAEVSAIRVFQPSRATSEADGDAAEPTQAQPLYALFSPLKPGVYVFDHRWQPKFVFPAVETNVLNIRDVQLSDLNGDGDPELLVAFTETAGLHAVSSEGKRLWTNRAYAPVLSIAPFRRMVYLTGRGGILPLDRTGREETPQALAGWTIAHLFAPQFLESTQAHYVGIAANADQQPCLVGINLSLEETWNLPLSGSGPKQPVDFVTSGNIRPGSLGEWVVGWGDGTIHIVSEDGEFDDSFGTGEEVRGIALAKVGDRPLLIVTSPKGATAWYLEP